MPKIAVNRRGIVFRSGEGLPDVPWGGVEVTELQKTLILEKFEAGNHNFSIIDVGTILPPLNSDAPMSESRVAQAINEALGKTGVIARAANRTGVATAASVSPANPVAIPGCVIAVPPSKRDVLLVTQAVWSIQVAGAGRLQLPVYSLSGGVATLVNAPYRVTAAASPAAGNFGGPQSDEYLIGPSDDWRIYGLYAQVARDAGSNLAASVFNFASVGAQSLIKAVAQ